MDKLYFMKMFLAMGEMTEQTQQEKVAYKERIIFATEGIIKPENWDSLSITEREKRLNLLTKQI
tara:strand:- start:605 stop:796 length:192 start_codon:yes stop_codon:yes gene_type:complete